MAKTKTVFVCKDCGTEYGQWQGQCAACKAWNTLSQVNLGSSSSPVTKADFRRQGYAGDQSNVQSLSDIDLQSLPRYSSSIEELDRVLGGGLVPGSVVLIGGNPGAGKSTLLLQIMCQLADSGRPALYVTGEESLQQVGMRANRLNLPTDNLKMLAETNVEQISRAAEEHKPELLVVDSIQVMHSADVPSAPGSVSQVRECAAYLIQYAKQTNTVLFLVGHVTKEGNLAGPKVLEHMIDCFIMLEGGNDTKYRILRGQKNRFGAVNELGVFAMTELGLKEVKNPSAIFLARTEEDTPGSLVMVLWEGTRPLLVEIQALVDTSPLGNPRRVTVGLEQNRLAMLLAVLHRHGGLYMADQDVFVNVVGGVKVSETSADLALVLAIVSSFKDRSLAKELVVFGEVGLAGEIRPVPGGQERLAEAAKHGFKRAIVPKANLPKTKIEGLEVLGVTKISQALDAI
ncbi:MAG: DNA repair protein RadA [Pseudohongiellaceae bacterium]|uniref:DNA repair protein RadA n=1 Tax=OM182 bacterium MED-G28 TaxID=1986256 RepID=A0A2A5WFH7_9GAMM|nr:DNA repair protein RadA [Gammaproteobacteria bacterium]PDH35018.1 MAG: DNA repair protein RadA [OM182 bacterium MED-G28]